MSRRIEIELTSDRGDGTWTWRAAGARKPRGVVDAALVPGDAKVGDVFRAETEMDIEGVTITALGSTQTRQRVEPERIEIIGSGRTDDQLVTTQLAPKGRGDRGDRGDRRDRPPRRDRPEGDRDRPPRREGAPGRGARPEGGDKRDRPPRGDRPDGDRRPGTDRPEGDRRPRSDRPAGDRRPRRPAPPPLPERPKPKRLRAGKVHRRAVLEELPAEHQPIAEEVLRGGIPAVRQAIDAQNESLTAAGQPTINGPALLKIAEQLLPRLRTADWRDRAEAALADADHLDLRDLRSVVVASDQAARDNETRELAAQLRAKLEERVVAEQALWLEDLHLAIDAGRIVRALRVSSRPPKAGTMLSPDMRLALTGGANAALTEDATPDRWAAVLDAIAFSPVRTEVAPVSMPATPSDELLAVIKKYASRVPKVAAAFGINVPAPSRPTGRALRPPKPPRRPGTVPVPPRPDTAGIAAPKPAPAPAAPAAEAAVAEAAPEVDEATEFVETTEAVATEAVEDTEAQAEAPSPEVVAGQTEPETPEVEPAEPIASEPAREIVEPEPASVAAAAPEPTEPTPAPQPEFESEPAADGGASGPTSEDTVSPEVAEVAIEDAVERNAPPAEDVDLVEEPAHSEG